MKKLVHVLAWLAIIGNLCLIALIAFWLLFPYKTTYVNQPIEILNANHEIRIGDPIKVKLEVNKPNGLAPESQRFIVCEDGNLVTIAKSSMTLPRGSYIIISDKADLPPKVAIGATCKLQITNTYRLNPIRNETDTWLSENFKVIQ